MMKEVILVEFGFFIVAKRPARQTGITLIHIALYATLSCMPLILTKNIDLVYVSTSVPHIESSKCYKYLMI